MKNILDTNTLSEPIPVWVRVHGFAALVICMVALIMFSFFFEIERVAKIRVTWSEGNPSVVCGTSEYDAIRGMTQITVKLEAEKSGELKLTLNDEATVVGNNMVIRAIVVDQNQAFQATEGNDLVGLVTVERTTLLSKLFEKAKPKI